ncbi:MAG: DUF4139 domain-containing protein, partial [Candidatus Hydrogenedentes bacterium]|nr:DUF4139 domain-containing protein [Candidatus Hydrogenedentota bacterium]
NSADLTLVRDERELTMKKGDNVLQFSWAGTLIDPTSLDMLPKKFADKIDIFDITYPPRVRNLGLWHIRSGVSGGVPVEITYFTSGLSWRAFYLGTLTHDEKTMDLDGYVRVTNHSGEDYPDAETRLIVGRIHILDRIAELARREFPYGRPFPPIPVLAAPAAKAVDELRMLDREAISKRARAEPKEIRKEGLSEYFLYTIEGTETIPDGWSKRLPSFKVKGVPVKNLYKYEEERYGENVVRFLSFKNDKEHNLGETPIPDGVIKVFRTADEQAHLSYTGQAGFKYIPVDEDVELNLGLAPDVRVKPKLMKYSTVNYSFDRRGNIDGFDEITTFKVEVDNFRDIAARVEVTRNFPNQQFDLKKSGDFDKFEQVDMDTVKFTLELPAHGKREFAYTHTQYHGTRQDVRAGRLLQ